MQLSHTRPVVSATFDEPNLVSAAGLVPLMALARTAGLRELADERLSVPSDKGANAGLKLSSLVAGMAAGADSIDDMGLLRHGGMGKLFDRAYAPSTLDSFLRSFTFGHVRQADAVASRFLLGLAAHTHLLGDVAHSGTVMVDLDDTIIEVHGYKKQGAAFGYSGVRGLNALLPRACAASTRQLQLSQIPDAGSCMKHVGQICGCGSSGFFGLRSRGAAAARRGRAAGFAVSCAVSALARARASASAMASTGTSTANRR